MADLVISDADLQSLIGALRLTLTDLEALQRSFRHMDVSAVGAPPLREEETTFTVTRDQDLTTLGGGVAARLDQAERVAPTITAADEHLARHAQRAE